MNKETLKYINDQQLTSVMNKTKWNKLADALNSSNDFVPSVRYKLIRQAEQNSEFSKVWWDELLRDAEKIEWLEIESFNREQVGKLVSDRKIDFSGFISKQLKDNAIPYTLEDSMYKVWGYLRPGVSPDFK